MREELSIHSWTQLPADCFSFLKGKKKHWKNLHATACYIWLGLCDHISVRASYDTCVCVVLTFCFLLFVQISAKSFIPIISMFPCPITFRETCLVLCLYSTMHSPTPTGREKEHTPSASDGVTLNKQRLLSISGKRQQTQYRCCFLQHPHAFCNKSFFHCKYFIGEHLINVYMWWL